MKPFLRPALALLLGTAALSLTACDYQYSPGNNHAFAAGFTNPPGYRNQDVNRDSINYKQRTTVPRGEGSATAIRNGTVQEQLDSAPAGASAASPQTASGKLGSVEEATGGAPATEE